MLWVFLATFLMSSVLVGQQSISWFLRRTSSQRLQWFGTVTATCVFAILSVDAMQSINVLDRPELGTLFRVAILLATCLLSWLYVWHAFRARTGLGRWRIPVEVVLLLTSAASTAWSAQKFYHTAMPPMFAPPPNKIPQHAGESRRFIGITDRGRDVTLMRFRPENEGHATAIWNALTDMIKNAPTAILRAGPDSRSNCHGWVFTGGRFLLDGPGVARILEDNGYSAVSQPQPLDVVIYRDSQGEINHTGLVKAVLADGTVLIESKWSVGARFLHLPEDQPYSPRFTYYRTSRPTHVVTIRFRFPEHVSQGAEERGRANPANAPRGHAGNAKTKNGDRVAVLFRPVVDATLT